MSEQSTNPRSRPLNLVLCSDGTGNKGGSTPDSNVFKVYNAVDIHSILASPTSLNRRTQAGASQNQGKKSANRKKRHTVYPPVAAWRPYFTRRTKSGKDRSSGQAAFAPARPTR